MNIWISDGLNDIPGNRLIPRKRFKESLDEILSIEYDKEKVLVCLESKVFGIGMESYTVGSSEFTVNYAKEIGIVPLMDNGHYHPTEVVSDKLSAMLLFHDKVAFHVTRSVRWDSDHVVLFDDETKEIIRNEALEKVYLGLDFFDASINRVSAWVVGMQNIQKAILSVLLMPMDILTSLQDEKNLTKIMALQESLKTYPFSDVWNYFLNKHSKPLYFDWFKEIEEYEKEKKYYKRENKNVVEAKFVQGFIRMCGDGYLQGWHERNGGNLTYCIKEKEIREIEKHLRFNTEVLMIGVEVPTLAGEYFLVTGSGKFFRNVTDQPEENIAIIKIDTTRSKYQILW